MHPEVADIDHFLPRNWFGVSLILSIASESKGSYKFNLKSPEVSCKERHMMHQVGGQSSAI
jgi:hypothetical protein